ncbi:MAG: hypothetical protein WCP97_08140, partial [bacterium]
MKAYFLPNPQITLAALKKVFSRLRYVVFAVGIAAIFLALTIWSRNWAVIGSSIFTFWEKISVMFSLLGGLFTDFTLLSAFLLTFI